MTTTAATLAAERWLDEVIILCSIDNTMGASFVESFSSPAGIGDLAIMSIVCSVPSVATVPGAATAARGIRAVILSADVATVVDVVGVAEWYGTGGALAAFDRFDAYLDPDALVLWRQGELLTFASPEMDVNAAPTADFRASVKCVRVRPVEAVGGPLQLVR